MRNSRKEAIVYHVEPLLTDHPLRASGVTHIVVDEANLVQAFFLDASAAQRHADFLNGRLPEVVRQEAERYYLFSNSGGLLADYADLGALVNDLKGMIAQPTAIYVRVDVIHGRRLYLSKGAPKYLLIPGQEPVALFDRPASLEPDPEGWLSEAAASGDG